MAGKILTEKQEALLKALFTQRDIKENFYLTGGTALAEYYLGHRYSEDLDFFTPNEFEPLNIQVILKSLSEKLKTKKIDYQKSFNRNLFFLHFIKGGFIKTEFTFYPFEQIEKPKKVGNIIVDSLIDIAVNKAFTIYQNPRSRDFIDLYIIMIKENWNLKDIYKKAQSKFETYIDPLQLAQQISEINNLKDYPRMIISLKTDKWKSFWLNELNKLKKEVIK